MTLQVIYETDHADRIKYRVGCLYPQEEHILPGYEKKN